MEKAINSRQKTMLVIAAMVSGFGMYASDYPISLPFLYWFALVPLLYWLLKAPFPLLWYLIGGGVYGLLSALTAIHLDAGPIGTAALIFYNTLWSLLLFFGFYWTGRLFKAPEKGVLLFPLWLVVMDFACQSVYPVWGTANSLSRTQTAYPFLIQIAQLTGQNGISFFMAVMSSFLACSLCFLSGCRKFLLPVVIFSVLSGLFLLANSHLAESNPPTNFLEVTALGWQNTGNKPVRWQDRLDRIEQTLQKERRKTALLVYPEVAFWPKSKKNLNRLLKRLAGISRRFSLHQVVGVFDETDQKNRILFFDPLGRIRGIYEKTHLIPFVENYKAGAGHIFAMDISGIRVGGLICQDDNFQDIALKNARQGVKILADPTNDWIAVMNYHAENLIYRAVENGFSIVRAASNGISLLVNYQGEVIQSRGPVKNLTQTKEFFVSGSLPIGEGQTFFTRSGNLWPWLCLGLLLLLSGGKLLFLWRFGKGKGDTP